jgi:hypothetical protein
VLLYFTAAELDQVTSKGIEHELGFNYSDGRWGFRSVNVGTWSLINLWSGAWFHSVQADINTKQPTVNGDYMWGSIYNGLASFPFAYFAYFGASATVDRNITDPDKVNWNSFNVSVSSSFMASAFISLVERNSAGEDQQEIKLSALGWGYNGTASNKLTNKTAGLYAFVFDGTRLVFNWPTVQLQYIITQIAGELNIFDGVSVYPKSLESIVLIDDWRYKNTSNHLVLKLALGTLKGSWTTDGQLTAGNGAGKVYFHLEKEAIIDGVLTPVKIGAKINATADVAFQNADITVQLNSKYASEAACEIIEIEFPPGATSIVYDPTMGSGDSPFEPVPPQPSNVLPIVLGVVGASVVVILVVVIILYCGQRQGYTTVA